MRKLVENCCRRSQWR